MIYILLPTIEEHYKNRMLSQFSSKYLSKTFKKSVYDFAILTLTSVSILKFIFVTLAVLTSSQNP